MMTRRLLASVEEAKHNYGEGCAQAKLDLLSRLEHLRLPTARAVFRLHEALCFLRAYPDDARVLALVEHMLGNFHRRADLRRHRAALADTGIAGTAIHDRFFWSSARWLAYCWPEALAFDRRDRDAEEKLGSALLLLVTPAEAAWLKESRIRTFAALDALRPPGENDAVFFVRLVDAMPGDAATREAFFDAIDASCRLKPGERTPCRSREKLAGTPVAFRSEPLSRSRPDLRREIALAPRAVRELAPREASAVLELARGLMVSRARDLDAFAYGDARDVRNVEDWRGLSFTLNSVLPERRALLPALYGYLILQNGVPIGYGDLNLVGRAASVAFNTLQTFRGGESAWIFARLLSVLRHMFGSRSFHLDPYQLGRENDEAIASGAWWFYIKLGFRPRAGEAIRAARMELDRSKENPGYRSDRATLKKLARWDLFFDLDGWRPAAPTVAIGPRVAQCLAARGGADRERALRECSREAMRIAGLRSLAGFSADERLAWSRWSPLLVALPGLARWAAAEKRALVRVIRAKGGRREGKFVTLFANHRKLQQALRQAG